MGGRNAGTENFPVASRFLPAEMRGPVMAFYAFARAADDIADAPGVSGSDKVKALKAFGAQLESGAAEPSAVVYALSRSLGETGVSTEHAQNLLKAFMRDTANPRVETWADLMAYCDLSAAPVGRYLIDLAGGLQCGDYGASDALCAALQVLNHIQDVKADCSKLGRVYVPADWMAQAGVKRDDLTCFETKPELRAVFDRMLDGVDDLLNRAQPLPRQIRSRALAREAGGILAIAHSLAKALRARDPLAGRVRLSKPYAALRFIWGAMTARVGYCDPMHAPEPAHSVGSYSGSSFYWALKLLPAARRDAMFRVYAFCREVDDIADGDDAPAVKMARLKQYRDAVEAVFAGGKVDVLSVVALKPVIDRYKIAQADLLAVIDGMESDSRAAVRIADADAFDRYLDQVACAVGRLSDKVFGLEGAEAEKLAHHLGRALQITNILRDLHEDAGRDRLYLPADLLARHGVSGATPVAILAHENLDEALDELAVQAEGCFRRTDEALSHLDRVRTRPARMMQAVYREILRRLRHRGLARVRQPVRLSKLTKLWIAVRYGLIG